MVVDTMEVDMGTADTTTTVTMDFMVRGTNENGTDPIGHLIASIILYYIELKSICIYNFPLYFSQIYDILFITYYQDIEAVKQFHYT